MLLRLLPIALLVCTLFAVPQATATCAGLESGGSCIGVYDSCPITQDCKFEDTYICVGTYTGTRCAGIEKP